MEVTDASRYLSPMVNRQIARDFVRRVSSILQAIARSIEQFAYESESRDRANGEFHLTEFYLAVQKVNFRFKANSGRLITHVDFEKAIQSAKKEILVLLDDHAYPESEEILVRLPSIRNFQDADYLHPAFREARQLGAFSALRFLDQSLDAVENETPFSIANRSEIEQDVEAVKKKIPEQKIAPAQFEVRSGRLIVIDQASRPKDGSLEAVDQSLDTLIDQGQDIADHLRNSNCDNRLCKQFTNLQETLKSGKNIVQLGIQNITSRSMTAALADEIPDAVRAMIDGHATGISMYVAQFSEWQTFIQNTAEAAIGDNVESSLTSFVSELCEKMNEYSAVVDPKVPQTIVFLAEMLSDPARSSKRAIFAFMRTIENLISKSFGFVIDVASKTADKTSDKLSDAASSAIVNALVGIGLISAAGLIPVVSGVSGMEWIESAFRVVSERIAPQLGIF